MKYSGSFNYDLDFGEAAEDWLKDLGKVEVKSDRLAHITGNIFIEIYYKGRPSGLSTTEADYWVYKIAKTNLALIIPVYVLKSVVKQHFTKLKSGGDGSQGVLISFEQIIKYEKP